jgi:hypothetical protein
MSPRMNNSDNFNNQNEYIGTIDINNNDYDYDDNDDANVYDTYEAGPTKYNIVLCEIYHNMHGNNENLFYNYLTISRFKTFDIDEINEIAEFYNSHYGDIENKSELSPIRNFQNIISRENYIKPEIAKHIVLASGHSICILKTFWLKIVQRCWKNIFNKRKDILHTRCQPSSLRFREINGRWPDSCANLPTLRGMLSSLRNV